MILTNLLFESYFQDFNFDEFMARNPVLFGSGQTRDVYEYKTDFVIKVALGNNGEKHINLNEVNNHECLTEKYSAKIFDYDRSVIAGFQGPKWIIMERVKVNPYGSMMKLEKLVPIDDAIMLELKRDPDRVFMYFSFALDVVTTNKRRSKQAIAQRIADGFKGEWIKGLIDRLKKCEVDSFDFHSLNWGVRESTGELVLIDYGDKI